MCTLPSWNRLWGLTGTGESWDPAHFDRQHCWKGMGMNGCRNKKGYWYLR